MTEETRERADAVIAELIANAQRHMAESEKLRAETAKIQAESRWYPFVALAGVMLSALGVFAAVAAVTRYFLVG